MISGLVEIALLTIVACLPLAPHSHGETAPTHRRHRLPWRRTSRTRRGFLEASVQPSGEETLHMQRRHRPSESRHLDVVYGTSTAALPPSCSDLNLVGGDELLAVGATANHVCVTGHGYESRANATVKMISDALKLLEHQGKTPRASMNSKLTIDIGDRFNCSRANGSVLAYAYGPEGAEACRDRVRLIPDFSYFAWPEAGLLPNFTTLAERLHEGGTLPAEHRMCGWIGSVATDPQRKTLLEVGNSHPDLLDIRSPAATSGTGGGRLSMEEQVASWSCLIDVSARGYSGRLPLLLHSGRPLLIARRSNGRFLDYTWTAEGTPVRLEAWKHFIPVMHNLSNLAERASWALDPANEAKVREIAGTATQYAQSFLNYDYAINELALTLYDVLSNGTEADSEASV